MQRLDFAMPEFLRHTWASDAARRAWEPRLCNIHKLIVDLAIFSVLEGGRPCALAVIAGWQLFDLYAALPPQELVSELVSCDRPLDGWYFDNPLGRQYHRPVYYSVVIGKPEEVAEFKDSWARADYSALDQQLGYPSCCRAFHQELASTQTWLDPTWPIAIHTPPRPTTEFSCDVTSSPYNNFLWRWMGVRLVPHLPCGFDCEPSKKLGKDLLDLAHCAGFQQEADDLIEVLTWPVEWSALHGVAEIKTPILKILANTDATAQKYAVRYKGTSYPKEGAQGLAFPYRHDSRLLLTQTASFRRNLED